MLRPARRAVADTLGLVRLLFSQEIDEGRREQLRRVGVSLGHAVTFSQRDLDPNTIGWRAIAEHCQTAFATLGAMGWSDDVKALIDAARGRVEKAALASKDLRGEAGAVEPSREEKRGARDRRNA